MKDIGVWYSVNSVALLAELVLVVAMMVAIAVAMLVVLVEVEVAELEDVVVEVVDETEIDETGRST